MLRFDFVVCRKTNFTFYVHNPFGLGMLCVLLHRQPFACHQILIHLIFGVFFCLWFSILKVLEVIAPIKHFSKFKEFVAMKLPPGFPVRIGKCFHFMLGLFLYTINYRFTLVTYKLHYEIATNQFNSTKRPHLPSHPLDDITRNCRAEAWQVGHVTLFVIVRGFLVNRSWTVRLIVLNCLFIPCCWKKIARLLSKPVILTCILPHCLHNTFMASHLICINY
jgi:hypothetical protein